MRRKEDRWEGAGKKSRHRNRAGGRGKGARPQAGGKTIRESMGNKRRCDEEEGARGGERKDGEEEGEGMTEWSDGRDWDQTREE